MYKLMEKTMTLGGLIRYLSALRREIGAETSPKMADRLPVYLASDPEGNGYGTLDKESSITVDGKVVTRITIFPCAEIEADDMPERLPDGTMKAPAEMTEEETNQWLNSAGERGTVIESTPAMVSSEWCKNSSHDQADATFADDNSCVCGIQKHHYHCSVCKKVTQIG